MNDSTFVVINDMRVVNNEKTRDGVIFGESKLRIGDSISITRLNQELLDSRRNLLNLRLFNKVEILIDRWTNENHIDLVFDVKERWYLYPLPVLELTGITFREWGDNFDYDFDRLTYGLNLYHFNFTERGDTFRATWKSGFQRQLGAGYVLPGIDKQRNWGISGAFNHTENKGATVGANGNEYDSPLFNETVFESNSASIGIIRRKDIIRRHSLSFIYSDIHVSDSIINRNPNYFQPNENHQKKYGLLYGFTLERRNLIEYPTNGNSIRAFAGYDGLFTKELNIFSLNAVYNHYKELTPRHFISGSAIVSVVADEELPFSNLISYGLSSSQKPRGYDQYRLFPKKYYGIKSEYRYDLITKEWGNIPLLPDRFEPVPFRILPKAYLDIAHSFSNQYVENNPLNNEFLIGYGVGFDVVTIYNTPFLFEFGGNHLGEFNFDIGIGKSF